MTATLTVGALLDEHVVLDVQCLDRIYLNGYVPGLQTPGGVWWFLRKHLGYAIASPAILEKIGTRFRRSVTKFAADNHIPVVRFGKDDRKIDVMARYVQAQAAKAITPKRSPTVRGLPVRLAHLHTDRQSPRRRCPSSRPSASLAAVIGPA